MCKFCDGERNGYKTVSFDAGVFGGMEIGLNILPASKKMEVTLYPDDPNDDEYVCTQLDIKACPWCGRQL